jgi:hypothetical protein
MHPESDIRRLSGRLMGRVLANSGIRFRKELPERATRLDIAPALNEMLNESASLWQEYLHLLIEPDIRISSKHRVRILNSLKVVLKSLLQSCSPEDTRLYLDPFIHLFFNGDANIERFVLADSLTNIRLSLLSDQECAGLSVSRASSFEAAILRKSYARFAFLRHLKTNSVHASTPSYCPRFPASEVKRSRR